MECTDTGKNMPHKADIERADSQQVMARLLFTEQFPSRLEREMQEVAQVAEEEQDVQLIADTLAVLCEVKCGEKCY